MHMKLVSNQICVYYEGMREEKHKLCNIIKLKFKNETGYTLVDGIHPVSSIMLFAQVLAGTMWWINRTPKQM